MIVITELAKAHCAPEKADTPATVTLLGDSALEANATVNRIEWSLSDKPTRPVLLTVQLQQRENPDRLELIRSFYVSRDGFDRFAFPAPAIVPRWANLVVTLGAAGKGIFSTVTVN